MGFKNWFGWLNKPETQTINYKDQYEKIESEPRVRKINVVQPQTLAKEISVSVTSVKKTVKKTAKKPVKKSVKKVTKKASK